MRAVVPRRQLVMRRLASVIVVLVAYAALTAGVYRHLEPPPANGSRVTVVQPAQPITRNIALRDGLFWVDGERFLVLSVGWDPTRPGELPWQRSLRFDELDHDLRRIRAAGFNTVRTWAPLSPEELAMVERYGLRVLQGIWVDPDGEFADASFRRRTLAEVARAVERSRFSPAILGYVILNEPRAKAVARAGLEQTRAFVREVVAAVRALDPSAPVGYASWPGMETLDDPLLDFVAFNVYPHRPRVVMDELGLAGYMRLLRDTVARGRPLLVSEYGLSVSPHAEVRGRGGATEEQQASGLVDLDRLFFSTGIAGTSVFQWSDGWWKNNEKTGDEQEHDPADPEEWFGLIRFASSSDRIGTPRPSLAALAQAHRAVIVAPVEGSVVDGAAPVRIVTGEAVQLEVSVNGGARYPVELWQAGGRMREGKLFLPPSGRREDVMLHVLDASGVEIHRERRLLRTSGRTASLALASAHKRVAPGETFAVDVQHTGATSISVATFVEDRYHEERKQVTTDARGRARVELRAPAEQTLLAVIAFEDDPQIPPAERAAAVIAVEVAP